MAPNNEKQDWTSVQNPPNNDRMVEVKDENGVTRYAYACYYKFDLINGKIVHLDNEVHDGGWMVDETIPFSKNEGHVFNKVTMWREIKQEGGE